MPGRRRSVKDELNDVLIDLERQDADIERYFWRLARAIQRLRELLRKWGAELGTATLPGDGGREVLLEAATGGVGSLSLVRKPDRSWEVRLDQGRPFRLQPTLGALLRVLAAPGGVPADDGFVGWKPYADVARMLGWTTPGPAARRYVTRKIWKLREALSRASQNRYLVQVDPRGVRFALRSRDTA